MNFCAYYRQTHRYFDNSVEKSDISQTHIGRSSAEDLLNLGRTALTRVGQDVRLLADSTVLSYSLNYY